MTDTIDLDYYEPEGRAEYDRDTNNDSDGFESGGLSPASATHVEESTRKRNAIGKVRWKEWARLRRVGQDDRDKCKRKTIWEEFGAASHFEKLAINGKIMDAATKYEYPLRKPWGSFSSAVRHGAGLTH